MPRLLVLRHAKSSWDEPGLEDHARPLARRGERAARAMGRHLAKRGRLPDRVLCSTAVRALRTLELLALPAEVQVQIESALYMAPAHRLRERLGELPPEVGTLLLVGHNPGLEDLVRELAREGRGRALRRLARGLKTASLAELRLPGESWAAAVLAGGRLVRLTRPKDLG